MGSIDDALYSLVGYREEREALPLVPGFSIPSKKLKLAFLELQPIMQKTSYSKVVSFDYKDGVLTLTANTTLVYEARIEVIGTAPTEKLKVSCMFQNIAEILPMKGDLSITINPSFVQITGENLEVSLYVCPDHVEPAPEVSGEGEKVDLNSLRSGLKKLLSLTAISNAFRKGNIIIFSGSYMQVRYSTVWVEASSSGLHTKLDLNSSSVIDKFIQNSKEAKIYKSRSYISIEKEMSTLHLPIEDVEDVESLEEFVSNFDYVDTISIVGLGKGLQSLLKTTGVGDCKVAVFDTGIMVESRTESITASVKIGEIGTAEKLLEQFTVPLEFLNSVINLMGDETVKLYRKGSSLCIKGPQVLAILSSG